jgi:PAS domain S-box-containing protein
VNKSPYSEDSSTTDFREALERDEIVPYFQPQIELGTGQLKGFEVLARWPHRSRGMLHPVTFIPLAENNGLIGRLTDNLLYTACAAAASWPNHLTLSVNVSPIQLRDGALPERVRSAVERTEFPLRRLVLEITETALMDDIGLARTIMQEFRALGVRLAIDDFGVGYSCLRHLQSLPFDELKVDASFIHAMTDQRESRKIVAAIICLGRSLGLTTLGEGIETREQADMLRCLGCEWGQGWLFGRPASAAETAAALDQGRWDTRAAAPATPIAADVALHLEAMPGQRLAHLQALYRGAPIGLAYMDRDLRYVSVNARMAEMHGLSIEKHIGRTLEELLPDLFILVEPHLRRSLLGEPVDDLMVPGWTSTREGPKSLYRASYQPVKDEAGEIVGLSVAVIDVATAT